MKEKVTVTIRFPKDTLRTFDSYVKKAGISREEFIRVLCSIVTTCDVKPSDCTKLAPAYREYKDDEE